MMSKIKILDCTLRDGGRIIDCAFSDFEINAVAQGLAAVGIDIIEVGFLRTPYFVDYNGDTTFFTNIRQIDKVIKEKSEKAEYVVFIDYGMYDFESLGAYEEGQVVSGIRVGFTKKDFVEEKEEIIRVLNLIKSKGYKLYIQGVNSLGYSDGEIIELVNMVNYISPYSFGIVDTYGAMYKKDLRRIFTLVDNNLEDEICIDFHSHNNFQLSFSLAQEIIEINQGKRDLIIDSTLEGMGKCAGNLNTELITDFLNRTQFKEYDGDLILDIIDKYVSKYKKHSQWGYSVPTMMAGIYKSHPNNIIYLIDKFDIGTKDIKYILNEMDEDKRLTYDYDNIERLYIDYNSSIIDDADNVNRLSKLCAERDVLIIAPGASLIEYQSKILEIVNKRNPIIFCVNFVYEQFKEQEYVFFGNNKRYFEANLESLQDRVIVTSNVKECHESNIKISYLNAIECGWKYFDNSVLMLLRILFNRANVKKVMIAGFDGYSQERNNYYDNNIENRRRENEFTRINRETKDMLKVMLHNKNYEVDFVTPSLYETSVKQLHIGK